MHSTRLIFGALVGVALVSCSGPGGSGGSSSTNAASSFLPAAAHSTHAKRSHAGVTCTLIDTVNPNSDFAGLGFTAASFTGGDHLNLDATGCTYGIYLSPGAKNLHISRAAVNGAYRVEIFAEQVSGVTIDHTAVNNKGGSSTGGIAFRGASGTVSNTTIASANTFGINIVANNACFGIGLGTCMLPDVSVSYTTIDNSKTTGDGVVVNGVVLPEVATASITHTTVRGGNFATPPGASQFELYGAQAGFLLADGNITATYDQSINNQVGFDSYCSYGFTNVANLNRVQHDTVSYTTPVSLTGGPIAENQVLNVISQEELDKAFGPGSC